MGNILTKFEHNLTNQYQDMVRDNIFLRFDLLIHIKQERRGANANARLFFKVENGQYRNESRVMSPAIHVRMVSGMTMVNVFAQHL